MKILHVYKDYFPVPGGIENHVKLLAEAQAARGHDVTVLVTSRSGTSHTEHINGVRILFASRIFEVSSAPFSIEMFRRVRELRPDITHLQSPYPFGEMAFNFFGSSRAMVLSYQSDIVRQKLAGRLYIPMLHRVLERADAILASSPNYIESSAILRQWRTKCVVVPLASHSLGLPPIPNPLPRTDLLFVGRLRYYKGVNYLLRALALLPNVSLTVVGIGPMENEWKKLARTLELDTRITWAGEVPDADLPAYYDACNIFVLPCSERSEAFGLVQLEAMAAARPVVSCDVDTGVAWVNQNGQTGLVVPPKNPRALADALTRLLGDAALRAQMGAAGRARVASEFGVDKMAERVMAVYERVREKKQ